MTNKHEYRENNTRRFLKIAGKIEIRRETALKVVQRFQNDEDLLQKSAELENRLRKALYRSTARYKGILKNYFSEADHPLLNLYFMTLFTEQTWDYYRIRKIPESIYLDTMTDIGIWTESCCRETGGTGLTEIDWIRKHLMGRIFKLGRLQFEPGRFGRIWKGFTWWTPCLSIHIPEGEKLDAQRSLDSIERAKTFFPRYFGREYRLASCRSWLLHENLKSILPPDSNIIQFADLFEILNNDKNSRQALDRVFGYGSVVTSQLPENTSLQRNMKTGLMEGKSFGMGFGIIDLTSR